MELLILLGIAALIKGATSGSSGSQSTRLPEGYLFSHEKVGDQWRPYIMSQPDYNGRDEGLVTTHRLPDEDDRLYVCWDRPLKSREDSETVAARWATLTDQYIRTGQTFGD